MERNYDLGANKKILQSRTKIHCNIIIKMRLNLLKIQRVLSFIPYRISFFPTFRPALIFWILAVDPDAIVKYFLEKGYRVDAVDGSEEICKITREYVKIEVKKMLFSELSFVNKYEGIWACSSILHLSKDELQDVLYK